MEPQAKEKINRIKEGLSGDPASPSVQLDGIYFFVSLDLGNSTAYKTKQNDWPLLISQFYGIAKHETYKNSFDPIMEVCRR